MSFEIPSKEILNSYITFPVFMHVIVSCHKPSFVSSGHTVYCFSKKKGCVVEIKSQIAKCKAVKFHKWLTSVALGLEIHSARFYQFIMVSSCVFITDVHKSLFIFC